MQSICAFCNLGPGRVVLANDEALVIRDAYPVSPGHSLIIPRQHVGSFFELRASEQTAMMALLRQAKVALDQQFSPQGYNVGLNDGAAAGQTVPHVHLHLIPRYTGDRTDPRGGVRWIIPERADYWSKP